MEILKYDIITDDSKKRLIEAINRRITPLKDATGKWIPQGGIDHVCYGKSFFHEYSQAMILVKIESKKEKEY